MQTISYEGYSLSIDIGSFLATEEQSLNEEAIKKIESFIEKASGLRDDAILQAPLKNLVTYLQNLDSTDLASRVSALVVKIQSPISEDPASLDELSALGKMALSSNDEKKNDS